MRRKNIILIITAFFCLTGCAIAVPIAVTGTAGMVAMDGRSSGKIVDDSMIITKIKTHFAKASANNFLTKISVNCYEGRVMLTGILREHQYVDEAERIAWGIHGVKEVINELTVAESPENNLLDMFISSTIKTKFLFEKSFDSLHYSYDVADSVVYIIGVAEDEDQVNKALQIVRSIKGVKKVVNHIILKSDRRRISKV